MDPQSTEYRITKTNTQASLSFMLGILALIPAVLIVLLLPALVGLTAIAQQSDSAVLYRSLAVFWMLYMGMVCLFDFPLGMASLVTGILALASLRSSAGGKGKPRLYRRDFRLTLREARANAWRSWRSSLAVSA